MKPQTKNIQLYDLIVFNTKTEYSQSFYIPVKKNLDGTWNCVIKSFHHREQQIIYQENVHLGGVMTTDKRRDHYLVCRVK